MDVILQVISQFKDLEEELELSKETCMADLIRVTEREEK